MGRRRGWRPLAALLGAPGVAHAVHPGPFAVIVPPAHRAVTLLRLSMQVPLVIEALRLRAQVPGTDGRAGRA